MRPKPSIYLGHFDPFRFKVANRYYHTSYIETANTGNLTAGWIYCYPWYTPVNMRIDRIAAYCSNTAVGANEFRLGIYQDDGSGNLYPGNLIVSSDELNGNTTGVKETTIDTYLTGGRIYHSVILANGGIGFRTSNQTGYYDHLYGRNNTLDANGTSGWAGNIGYGALPDPAPSNFTGSSTGSLVWLRVKNW